MIRALRISATIGLWVLAGAGLLGAMTWVLAQFGIAQPLVVVSDSMRPALRTGDIVLAVRVPVAELRPGDVVSVDRDDESRFITHRLVAASPASGVGAGSGTDWSLTLKGDANPVADPEPYPIGSHALKVVWTAPFRLPLGITEQLATASDDATGLGVPLGLAEAAWRDAVHVLLELTTPIAGPAPYAIATTTEWNRLSATSEATCHDGATIEYEWAPSGEWVTLTGGGDAPDIDAVFTWDQRVTLHAQARCWEDGRVSDWVPATNNGVRHGIRRPWVVAYSGYTHAPSRRFEAHFRCPDGTTSATTSIGVRRDGSSPTTRFWQTSGTDLVVNWSGTMGNGSVMVMASCTGPWGVVQAESPHRFGPGCVPTANVPICTNYYRG